MLLGYDAQVLAKNTRTVVFSSVYSEDILPLKAPTHTLVVYCA